MCYYLEIDGHGILLDCGWDERFSDEKLLAPLQEVAHKVQTILISHADVEHMGALPYVCAKGGLGSANIFVTYPQHKMGQMHFYDYVLARTSEEEFNKFDLDDVDAVFSQMTKLKYEEMYTVVSRGESTTGGITVTPVCAGHSLGGAVWKIKSGNHEEVVYAVDYNHMKERHLNGFDADSVLDHGKKPSILITSTINADCALRPPRKIRDSTFTDHILATLRRNKKVLLPLNPAGRVLEHLLHLDSYWAHHNLGSVYPIIFAGRCCYNTVEFAKCHIEWMCDSVSRTFERHRENPYELRHVNFCHTMDDIKTFGEDRAMVVLATFGSLEGGFSRELFSEWSEDEGNLVLLTEKGPPNTLCRTLYDQVVQESVQDPTVFKLNFSRRVPMQGEERSKWIAAKKDSLEEERREREEERKKLKSEEENEGIFMVAADNIVVSDTRARLKLRHMEGRMGVLIDGFEPASESITPLMFPNEKASEFVGADEYGAILEEGKYTREDMQHAIGLGDKMDTNLSEDIWQLEPPTVVEQYHVSVELKAQLVYIDFEGRSDFRSIKAILQHISPASKLVLVHGNSTSMGLISIFSEGQLARSDVVRSEMVKSGQSAENFVLIPALGDEYDLTPACRNLSLHLTPALVAGLKWHSILGYDVAYVRSHLSPNQDPGMDEQPQSLDTIRIPIQTDEMDVDGGEKDSWSHSYSLPVHALGHRAIMLGETKLSELRKGVTGKLKAQSDLSAGVLLNWSQNRSTTYSSAVYKPVASLAPVSLGTDVVIMAGPLDESYFAARELLYGQHARI